MRIPLLIPRCRDRDPGGPPVKQRVVELFSGSVLREIPRSIPSLAPLMILRPPRGAWSKRDRHI